MNYEMRRKDRQMSREFALDVTDRCEYAIISMTDSDKAPYCIPLSIVRDGDFIYFHCAAQGRKVDILRKNPAVCICCVGDTVRQEDKFTTKYQSAVIFGRAKEVVSDEEKIHALRLLCQRHAPSNMKNFDVTIEKSLKITCVWKVKIEEISGKCNG